MLVREKGIKGVDEIAERRHWDEFINDPGVANKTLVREFYANLKFIDQQHHVVTVRGKSVNFSAKTINSFFCIPSINTHGKLQGFMEDHIPLDIICELLPTTHTSDITKDCVVMIYTILTDVVFDIGRFLHRSIWKNAMGGLSVGLYHLFLITALCARAVGLEERVDRLADEVHQLQLQQEQTFCINSSGKHYGLIR
ncbi:hypothetical protein CDL12_12264 [Handroanthus impetiginosus]|uniref:Putative plant transposon protein domain-containing protein n=1 Tax=Handroanthus impetiginosus TaxID=429701 RepID=A0A2G9HC28_9LAMI|nr:hypothetical protein CDL12_12264 [Handroanthus impetiginosus]